MHAEQKCYVLTDTSCLKPFAFPKHPLNEKAFTCHSAKYLWSAYEVTDSVPSTVWGDKVSLVSKADKGSTSPYLHSSWGDKWQVREEANK